MPDNARPGRSDHPPRAQPDQGAGEPTVRGSQALVETGDLVIVRMESPDARARYEFRIHGGSWMPVCFTRFEQAAMAGERLARQKRVRLFFHEHEDEAPSLLRDFRRPGDHQF